MRQDLEPVEQCEFFHAHEEIVKKVMQAMPGEEELYDLAELFKIFGDSPRIRILYVLFESEMCVCDIAERGFASAAPAQTEPAGQKPPGGQNGILFSGRRSCPHDHRSGQRAY